MAEKDIMEKILFSYADIFADCGNVFIYGGEQILKAEEMQPAPTESFYHAGSLSGGTEGIHNQFCDKSFYHVKNGKIQMQYILENETQLAKRQILRKASYQGGAYRQQLASGQAVYPVVSIVIDWTRKSSRIPLSLHELLRQDGTTQESLQLVDDMKLEVCHMRNLPKEVRRKFTSDMGFVADFLNEGNFESRRKQKIVHIEALCKMMETLTGDSRFTNKIDKLLKMQEGGREVMMCEYINMLEARGEAKGEARGEEKLSSLLTQLYALGREEDVKLALQDKDARKRLYQEICPAKA